jgi:hypothetical protein
MYRRETSGELGVYGLASVRMKGRASDIQSDCLWCQVLAAVWHRAIEAMGCSPVQSHGVARHGSLRNYRLHGVLYQPQYQAMVESVVCMLELCPSHLVSEAVTHSPHLPLWCHPF